MTVHYQIKVHPNNFDSNLEFKWKSPSKSVPNQSHWS